MTIRLVRAAWEVDLRPELGGSIVALRRDGVDILRPTPDDTVHPLETACFALVPYANRIAYGRFAVDNQTIALPRNVEGQDHPLHGIGWLRAWNVEHVADYRATLTHIHRHDADWPWDYDAVQVFTLDTSGLQVTLRVTNRDRRPMPVSLGFHPYILKAGIDWLRFDAQAVWLTDDARLPTVAAPADTLGDWTVGDSVDRSGLIDNCYAGWCGVATMAHRAGSLRVTAGDAAFVHLFMPPGEAFFCLEPVTAMPDAVNRAAPTTLALGESRALTMTIAMS